MPRTRSLLPAPASPPAAPPEWPMKRSHLPALVVAVAAALAAPALAQAPLAVGEALYQANCIMCHGQNGSGGYATRGIQNAKATKITDAMVRFPLDMGFLTFMAATDLAQIETYLKNVPKRVSLTGRPNVANGERIFRQNCSYCHGFGAAAINPPRPGMDLMGIPEGATWRASWIDDPGAMVAAGAFPAAELALYPYLMPDLGHAPADVWDVANFLVAQDAVGPVVQSAPIQLTAAQFDATKQVYFNRCAGCHGLMRGGATGPKINDVRAQAIGTDGLGSILRVGTPTGMGNYGKSGILTEQEIVNLAAYLQQPPPAPPPLPMADIQASWNLIVPVASRPTAPQHARNWENFTGVILRDPGQVAIIDGDRAEEVARVNTGFAVHILRSSSTGRYFYAIGRDGLVSMIDLWTPVPTIVATVKGCHDARSVEGSKFQGYEDKYVIEGCYWPPQYVVYDGLTLEPKQRVDVPMVDINGATLPEVRVASIAASHDHPVWLLALKESGFVGVVDYSVDPNGLDFPLTSQIP